LRAGFANLEKLPAYWTENVGVEHVFAVHSGGIREVKLRFDCLNVFDEVYEIRNGTGIGIAAPAYGPRRAFYGGLAVDFWSPSAEPASPPAPRSRQSPVRSGSERVAGQTPEAGRDHAAVGKEINAAALGANCYASC
jgi:hypothetical protein